MKMANSWPKDGELCANCGRNEEECDCHPYPFTPAKADGTPLAPEKLAAPASEKGE